MTKTRATERPATEAQEGQAEAETNQQSMRPVTQSLPRCNHCNATTIEMIRHIKIDEYCGTTSDGTRYTSIVWRRVKCRSCGRYQIHVHRPYDPSKWKK